MVGLTEEQAKEKVLACSFSRPFLTCFSSGVFLQGFVFFFLCMSRTLFASLAMLGLFGALCCFGGRRVPLVLFFAFFYS